MKMCWFLSFLFSFTLTLLLKQILEQIFKRRIQGSECCIKKCLLGVSDKGLPYNHLASTRHSTSAVGSAVCDTELPPAFLKATYLAVVHTEHFPCLALFCSVFFFFLCHQLFLLRLLFWVFVHSPPSPNL